MLEPMGVLFVMYVEFVALALITILGHGLPLVTVELGIFNIGCGSLTAIPPCFIDGERQRQQQQQQQQQLQQDQDGDGESAEEIGRFLIRRGLGDHDHDHNHDSSGLANDDDEEEKEFIISIFEASKGRRSSGTAETQHQNREYMNMLMQ